MRWEIISIELPNIREAVKLVGKCEGKVGVFTGVRGLIGQVV